MQKKAFATSTTAGAIGEALGVIAREQGVWASLMSPQPALADDLAHIEIAAGRPSSSPGNWELPHQATTKQMTARSYWQVRARSARIFQIEPCPRRGRYMARRR